MCGGKSGEGEGKEEGREIGEGREREEEG